MSVLKAMEVVFCSITGMWFVCAVNNESNKRGFTEHGNVSNCLKVFPILAIMFELLCNDWLIL